MPMTRDTGPAPGPPTTSATIPGGMGAPRPEHAGERHLDGLTADHGLRPTPDPPPGTRPRPDPWHAWHDGRTLTLTARQTAAQATYGPPTPRRATGRPAWVIADPHRGTITTVAI